MGNKSLSSPLPTYEAALAYYSANEIDSIKKMFMRHSNNQELISLERFQQLSMSTSNVPYIQKYILPRLFNACDTKKDGVIDIEEFTCVLALFRIGSIEEKIKFLYLMYDCNKAAMKDNLKQLLVDSTICVQNEDIALGVLEEWITDLQLLSESMLETAMIRFSSHSGKIDIAEFINFVKVESSIQGLLHMIPSIIDVETD